MQRGQEGQARIVRWWVELGEGEYGDWVVSCEWEKLDETQGEGGGGYQKQKQKIDKTVTLIIVNLTIILTYMLLMTYSFCISNSDNIKANKLIKSWPYRSE